MKRKVTFVALILLVIIIFTGCGKKNAGRDQLDDVMSMLEEELEGLGEEDFIPSGEYESEPGEQSSEAQQVTTEQANNFSSPEGADSAEPDLALLKTVRELVNKASNTKNYYFETWGNKVWHQGQQRKVELWELVDKNTLDITGERTFGGVILSDHGAQKFKQFMWDRKNKKWIVVEIPPMQAQIDLLNQYHDILGVRVSQLKELLDGWNGEGSEVQRSYPHKNNTITYLELKSIQIGEGTVIHERDNKTWQVYIVKVGSLERPKKGSDTVYDMEETYYVDKNTGFPVTYEVNASFNMHVTDTYEYFKVQTGTQTEIDFKTEPLPEGTPVSLSNEIQIPADNPAGISAGLNKGSSQVIPDDLTPGNDNSDI